MFIDEASAETEGYLWMPISTTVWPCLPDAVEFEGEMWRVRARTLNVWHPIPLHQFVGAISNLAGPYAGQDVCSAELWPATHHYEEKGHIVLLYWYYGRCHEHWRTFTSGPRALVLPAASPDAWLDDLVLSSSHSEP